MRSPKRSCVRSSGVLRFRRNPARSCRHRRLGRQAARAPCYRLQAPRARVRRAAPGPMKEVVVDGGGRFALRLCPYAPSSIAGFARDRQLGFLTGLLGQPIFKVSAKRLQWLARGAFYRRRDFGVLHRTRSRGPHRYRGAAPARYMACRRGRDDGRRYLVDALHRHAGVLAADSARLRRLDDQAVARHRGRGVVLALSSLRARAGWKRS